MNEAFSKTLRDVALRAIGAIGVTGASARRLMRDNVWRSRDIAEGFGGVWTRRSARRCVMLPFGQLGQLGLTGASALRLMRDNVWRSRDIAEGFGGVWTRRSVRRCVMLPCGQLG